MVYRAINDTHAKGKEIWFTEFGAWSSNTTTQERAYAYTLEVAKSRGADRVFAWAWQSINPSDEPYNICLNTHGSATPAFYELASRGTSPGDSDAILGDITCDGRVDMRDVVALVLSYGSLAGEATYDSNADVNGDGKVDMRDLSIVIMNFGKH